MNTIAIDAPDGISKHQAVQLWVLEHSSFNDFHGPTVCQSLLNNRKLWHSVVFAPGWPGCQLRDLPQGYNNADTCYIAVRENNKESVWAMAETWGADEIDWLKPDHDVMLGANGLCVLRVWWD